MPPIPQPKRAVIGITLGDPAGIGPEVTHAALASGKLPEACEFRILGARASKAASENSGHRPGAPSMAGAKEAWDALEEAVCLLKSGEIQALVTGPIHKESMHAAGFSWPGHTEFLGERFGVKDPLMILSGGPLTVGLVTAHCALMEVGQRLSVDKIVSTANRLRDFVELRLAKTDKVPRIAVAGLNPHAGENGAFGREEKEIITPAIEQLRQQWAGRAELSGPCVPDAVFREAAEGVYDAVVCMYHDQGLIPLKLLAFDKGVNITAGLPVIRTSPDHGTAFSIAGKDIARAKSMIAAICLAAELVSLKKALPSACR